MSPTNTPRATFNPLPPVLPKEDTASKKDKSTKDKTTPKEKSKPYVKTHKQGVSWDDSAYGSASPYSYEDRSPDQYAARSLKFRADEVKYEIINGKTRKVKYYTKDGKRYRYVTSTLEAAEDDDYVLDPNYKDKYKDAKKQTKVLSEVIADVEETAKYNYKAAKQEESAKMMAAATIEDLQARLRALALKAQINEDLLAEAERKAAIAQRKLEQRDIEDELRRRSEIARINEQRLAREQWEQIEASPSPIQRKRQSFPVAINQTSNRPRTTTVPGPVTTTTYGQTPASAYKSPLAPTVPFDAILEARADFEAGRSKPSRRSDEDRRFATGTQTGYTTQRTKRDEYRR